MRITIIPIDQTRKKDLNLPNQPFSLFGRLRPRFDGEAWSYDAEYFPPEQCDEMTFPEENYDFDTLAKNSVMFGAYDEVGQCVGVAIFQNAPGNYLYLYDLKVNAAYRKQGIGTLLINAGRALARERGYRGIYLLAQDNNLAACLFYLRVGFRIGGLDTMTYTGTSQEGKRDITFYLDESWLV